LHRLHEFEEIRHDPRNLGRPTGFRTAHDRKRAKGLGDILRTRGTFIRFSAHHLGDQIGKRGWYIGPQTLKTRRLVRKLRHDRVLDIQSLKREAAAERLKQCAAETIDVGPNVGVPSTPNLFRGHVGKRTQGSSRAREVTLVIDGRDEPPQTQIENPHVGSRPDRVRRDHQICGFQIPMEETTVMDVLKSHGGLPDAFAGPIDGNTLLSLDPLQKIPATDEFGHQKITVGVAARIEGQNNMRTLQR
jgi:hypothetical protein